MASWRPDAAQTAGGSSAGDRVLADRGLGEAGPGGGGMGSSAAQRTVHCACLGAPCPPLGLVVVQAAGPTKAAAPPVARRLGGVASRRDNGGGLATSSGGSRLGGCDRSISLVRLRLPAVQIWCGSTVAFRWELWLSSGPPRQGLGRGRSLARPSLASRFAMWAPCRQAWPGSCRR